VRSTQRRGDPFGGDRWRLGPAADPEGPILAELFSVERLEQHAQTLAAAQVVTATPGRGRLVRPRVADNGRVLLESYRLLARAMEHLERIVEASQAMVDGALGVMGSPVERASPPKP
jgi:hypothetical protein